MRRALAVTLALAALAVTLYVVGYGYVCGMKQVEACFSPEECEAKSECVSDPHPLAPPFVVLAVVGLVGVLAGRRDVTLAAAVLVSGLATLVGLSIGSIEIYAAALLVAAAFTLAPRDRRDRWLAWAGLAAILAAVPVFTLVARVGHGSPALLLLTLFAPALAWIAFAAVTIVGSHQDKRGAGEGE